MAAVMTPFDRTRQLIQQGAAVPLVLIGVLAMIVVPLPPMALDALFTLNIAVSLVVLLAVIYVRRPLEFSIFPTVLLLVTLMRLALNVASTRVVLLNGEPTSNQIDSEGNPLPLSTLVDYGSTFFTVPTGDSTVRVAADDGVGVTGTVSLLQRWL